MIKSVSLDKIRASGVTKIAGLFVLAVLAVAFFVLPLGAAAKSSASGSAQLYGAFFSCGQLVKNEVDNKSQTIYMFAPFLDRNVKVSGLAISSFFDATFNGTHVTGMVTGKNKALVIFQGKPQNVTLTDGGGTINSTKQK
jgi:hypothetical protein